MSLRLTTLLSAAVLTAAPVAMTAAPASAATCTTPAVSTKVGPRTVVVGPTGTGDFDIRVAVVAGGCTVSDVTAMVTTPNRTSEALPLTVVETDGDVTIYGAGLALAAADLENADAGKWRVKTTTQWLENATDDDSDDSDDDADDSDDDAGDDDGSVDDPGTGTAMSTRAGDDDGDDDDEADDSDEGIVQNAKIYVLRDAQLSADVTSTQLRRGKIGKGRSLHITGALTRADWEDGSYVGYAKQKVELQFRTDKGRYKKVRTLKTGSGGAFAETVKATKDGCYRLVFPGSKTTAQTPSSADCIDVR